MESEISVSQNGNRKESFDLLVFDKTLRVHNYTTYLQQTQPRRRMVTQLSAKTYLRNLCVLQTEYHIRPGQTLPELAWLQNPKQVQQRYLADCLQHFMEYCITPVPFLLKDNFFLQMMQDPWCFEQEEFLGCLEDFVRAYNSIHTVSLAAADLVVDVSELERAWKFTLHSAPIDLLQSGFIEVKASALCRPGSLLL